MSKWMRRLLQWGSGGGALLLAASLLFTNPSGLGPFGITVWFVVLLVVLTMVITLVMHRFRQVRDTTGLMRLIRRAFLISVWATALLALGSLRQLTIRDIILLTVLVVMVDFYIRRLQRS
jgi:hypothetical protein